MSIKFFVKYAIVLGLGLGLSLGLVAFSMTFFNENPVGRFELMFLNPILLAFLFLGMRYFRFKYNGGTLEGWKAMSIGVIIAILGAICYAALVAVIFTISEESLEIYRQQSELIVMRLKEDKPDMDMREMLAGVKEISPMTIAFQTYLRTLGLGIFFSFISALFQYDRKK